MGNQVQSILINFFVLNQKGDFAAVCPASDSIQYFSELLVKWSREYAEEVHVALHWEEQELHQATRWEFDMSTANWMQF